MAQPKYLRLQIGYAVRIHTRDYMNYQNSTPLPLLKTKARDQRRIVLVFESALAPIALAEELALKCSTKETRKSMTSRLIDYRLGARRLCKD